MPDAEPELHIRPPLWARVWIVLFLPVWLGIILANGPGAIGWVLAAFGVALGARMFVMGAVGTPDGRLTVRNQFTTRTFHRDELADARVDRANGRFGSGWTVCSSSTTGLATASS